LSTPARLVELKYLRDEIEVAQKAEADLRRAMIEIDGHAKRATRNHEAEKAKVQAAPYQQANSGGSMP
jgi:predicted  nucleic acid-binding Zn-ribbon protein